MNYACFASELVLLCSSLLLLVVGVIAGENWKYRIVYFGALAGLAGALYVGFAPADSCSLYGLGLATQHIVARRIILIIALAVMLASHNLNRRYPTIAIAEYPVLLLMCTMGLLISASASNFITLYLGLELQAIAMYIMVTLDNKSLQASESGLRYYIFGSMASALVLYGMSLIYAATGRVDMADINLGMIGTIGLVFTILGLCFKKAAFPMHGWAPCVYRGSSSMVTVFLATAPKIATFVVINGLLYRRIHSLAHYNHFYYFMCAIGLLSLAVGVFGALSQNNFKRFLAYSSIQNVGYTLILAPVQSAANVVMYYMAAYSAILIGIFGCMTLLSSEDAQLNDLKISDLSGLAQKDKFTATSMAVLLLSLAGIPPMAGFAAKASIFHAALAEGINPSIITAAALLSVAGMFYYLRIVKIMFFDDPERGSLVDKLRKDESITGHAVVLASLAFSFGLMFKPDALLKLLG